MDAWGDELFQDVVAPHALLAYLEASWLDLRKHAMPDGEVVEPVWEFDAVYQSASEIAKAGGSSQFEGGRAQISAYHVNPPGGQELLWERVICNGLSRQEYESLLASIEESVSLTRPIVSRCDDWFSPPALPEPGAMWRYHPERMFRYMSYGKEIARCGVKHLGEPTVDLMNDVMRSFSTHDNEMLFDRPARHRVAHDRNTGRAFSHFQETLLGYAMYCGNGRQIFDFPQKLIDMFSKSDVDDVQWAHIRMPYPCIYLHFGAQSTMDLGHGWLVEGAYISEIGPADNRHVNITVVGAPPSAARYYACDTETQPTYSSALAPQHMTIALAEALDLKLSEKIAELTDQASREPLAAEVERMAREQGVPPGVRVVSVQRKRATEELALLSGRHEAYKAALRLIVNALCYLTAYPKDIERSWPRTTPKFLLGELDKAGNNRNGKRAALNRLAAQGFTAVNFCGRALEAELSQQKNDINRPAGERVIATHWARGHWKRQPFGPQNSLRKLQWRMPVLRRSRHLTEPNGDEPLGHIYLAS